MTEVLPDLLGSWALLAALLASLACGVVGSLIVVRRSSAIAGGLSHAAFGGVGLAVVLGLPPLWSALGFALLCGALLAEAEQRRVAAFDTLVSMIWAGGMALGVLLMSLVPGGLPGHTPDLEGFLFGGLGLVQQQHLWLVAGIDVVVLLVLWRCFGPLRALAFDEQYARASGLPVRRLRHLFMALSVLAVVSVVRVVGVVLAIALLSIPAATARRRVDDLLPMMALATLIAAFCTLSGLALADWAARQWQLALPAGPLIVLLCLLLHGLERLIGARGGG